MPGHNFQIFFFCSVLHHTHSTSIQESNYATARCPKYFNHSVELIEHLVSAGYFMLTRKLELCLKKRDRLDGPLALFLPSLFYITMFLCVLIGRNSDTTKDNQTSSLVSYMAESETVYKIKGRGTGCYCQSKKLL